MLHHLQQRERDGRPIHIGLVGLGAMGCGIAYQIGKTPGMRLSFVADQNLAAAEQGQKVYGKRTHVTTDCAAALKDDSLPCDVFIEATNSIIAAYDYCELALQRKAHCVLMNAEVDLIFGPLLQAAAKKAGVIVTSDGGDQHGVLARMMEEVEMWGFKIMQAGNMKGFLHRHRDWAGTIDIAAKLNLSVQQCLAYTDGSKLNIEMAIIANEYGLGVTRPGMEGPQAGKVEEALELFDFDSYGSEGKVDYILGAKQFGGGVYVIGKCEDDFQQGYLNYYKVNNKHPYYLFFRPYHLCHLETPRAAALAALYGKAVCTQRMGRLTDCFAYAKTDLSAGTRVTHAIGSDQVYGLIDDAKKADALGMVPQGVLDVEGSDLRPVVKRKMTKDQPITWDDIEIPDTRMAQLWDQQQSLL
jgi:predicted homoserine dehydrogenase-like protein